MGVTLYTGTGSISVEVDDGSERTASLMGYDSVELDFSLAEDTDFPLRTYCDIDSRRYTLYHRAKVTKKNERQYDYRLTMYTYGYLLAVTLMKHTLLTYSGQTITDDDGDHRLKFPLTATPREHLQMIVDCLNNAEGANVWSIDYSKTLGMVQDNNGTYIYNNVSYRDCGDMKLVCYEAVSCEDALKAVAEAFGTEYEISGMVIALHKVEYNKDNQLVMKYGRGNGFESGVTRENESQMPPIDRMFVQGGENNIKPHYGQTYNSQSETYDGVQSATLLLPADVDDIRYDGSHFYCRVDIDGDSKQFYFDNVLKYSYGLYSLTGMRYKDEITGDVLNDMPTELDKFQESDGTLKDAVGWRRYVVDSDRRSIYRVKLDGNNWVKYRDTNVEGWYDGSEVYPMRIGAVSGVVVCSDSGGQTVKQIVTTGRPTYEGEPSECFYDILDNDNDVRSGALNYKTCGIAGEKMTVIFQDGMLAGREFEIQTVTETIDNVKDDRPNCRNSTVTHAGVSVTAYRIPLCQSDEDGIVMPGGVFVPAVGDHYAVFHCGLPDSYVNDAERRLLWEGVNALYYSEEPTYTFSGKVYPKWARENWTKSPYTQPDESTITGGIGARMALGQYIKLYDTELFGSDGLAMRITQIKQNVNDPMNIELTLTNAPLPTFNWAKRMANTVRQLNVRNRTFHPTNIVMPRQSASVMEFNSVDENPDGNSRRNPLTVRINELRGSTNESSSLLITFQGNYNGIVSKLYEFDSRMIAKGLYDSGESIFIGQDDDERRREATDVMVGGNETCPADISKACTKEEIVIDVPKVLPL